MLFSTKRENSSDKQRFHLFSWAKYMAKYRCYLSQVTHLHMENATAYGMFREKLVEIGSNEDKILVGHTSIHYGLTGGSMFHVARQAWMFYSSGFRS